MSNQKERLEILSKLERLSPEAYHLDNVMNSAKKAYLDGDVGLAAALLAKGSQYCEDNGLVSSSISLLALAERLLHG